VYKPKTVSFLFFSDTTIFVLKSVAVTGKNRMCYDAEAEYKENTQRKSSMVGLPV
jgi:hypothetical protein